MTAARPAARRRRRRQSGADRAGSDTNGSIRVPSSFCGIFGLKPTYGALSRARSFSVRLQFGSSRPVRANVGDLALAYDAMQGPDPEDAACTPGRPSR